MPGTRKMKGGVRLASGYTDRNHALSFFLGNSTFSVLTNNSISCITLVVTLNPLVNSPYTVLRHQNFRKCVDKILLKIFITAEDHGWITIPGRPVHGGIEITSKAEFNNEIRIQRDIYRKSFLSEASLLEPMCPHIINFHHCNKNGGTVEAFKNLNGLTAIEQQNLTIILNQQYNQFYNRQISFIAMEFMDGFKIARETLSTAQPHDKHFFWDMIQYEFQRLNMYKYKHGDAHFGNVMIHPTYNYLQNGQTGRALIIDFGRTEKKENININIVDNTLEIFRTNGTIPQSKLININRFNQMNAAKIQSMQQFYVDFGNYLHPHHPNNRTYATILPVLEQIIDSGSGPQIFNVGGASSKNMINTFMKTKYEDFRNNLIALFDDKANGELKGEIFELDRKRGGKQRKIKTRRKSKRRRKSKGRRTRTNPTKLRKRSINR